MRYLISAAKYAVGTLMASLLAFAFVAAAALAAFGYAEIPPAEVAIFYTVFVSLMGASFGVLAAWDERPKSG